MMTSVCLSQDLIHTLYPHGKDKVAETPTIAVAAAVTRLVDTEVGAKIVTDQGLGTVQGTEPHLSDKAHNLVTEAFRETLNVTVAQDLAITPMNVHPENGIMPTGAQAEHAVNATVVANTAILPLSVLVR